MASERLSDMVQLGLNPPVKITVACEQDNAQEVGQFQKMSDKLQFVAVHDKLKRIGHQTDPLLAEGGFGPFRRQGFVEEPSRNHLSPRRQSVPIPVGCDYHGLGVK
jgi:hypothetical protein